MHNVIREFLKRPIAYQPVVAKAFDSVTLAILWCQFFYWSDKTKDPDGWIYKTREEVYDETGLGRKSQETARKLGQKFGVLEYKRLGPQRIGNYRINEKKSFELLEKFIEKSPEEKKEMKEEKPKEPEKSRRENTLGWVKNIPVIDIKMLADKFRVSEQFVRARAEDLIDYCEAKGKRYSDYKAALRNFIKIELKRHPEATIINRMPNQTQKENEVVITPEQRARNVKKLNELREQLSQKFNIKKI